MVSADLTEVHRQLLKPETLSSNPIVLAAGQHAKCAGTSSQQADGKHTVLLLTCNPVTWNYACLPAYKSQPVC